MDGDVQKCSKKFIIGNKLGLHARPAAMFVKLANTFTSVPAGALPDTVSFVFG